MKRTAEQIYEDLVGTATGTMTEEEMDDTELMQQVDDLMFRCAGCEWWCEIGEASSGEDEDENYCADCSADCEYELGERP